MIVEPIVASDLDADRFGVSVARVRLESTTDVPSLIARCREIGIQLVMARVDVTDLDAAHALEGTGGLLCDTLVYYCRAPDDSMSASRRARIAGPEDAELVASIAAAAFVDYGGHYRADPRLDRAAVEQVYPDWARRACTVPGVADRVWLVDDEGEAAGFLALRFNDPAETEIVLNAVHPEHQRRGLYSDLLTTALAESFRQGAERCLVSTQVGNTSVQRVWSRLGFGIASAFHTFHVWLDVVPQRGPSEA
jgi:ribosomal protein S18 acetylase RimI-like enzyme